MTHDRATPRPARPPGPSWHRWRRLPLAAPGPLVLLALPLLLLLESDWFYSGPHRDAWIYYGYFQNGLAYLRQFPDLYYGSRLGLILPGFALHHLLPTEAANLVLHLALWWCSAFSAYGAGRHLFGQRIGLLGALALVLQPYFLQAASRNYTDGFGIAYVSLALCMLVGAPRSRCWCARPFAAGAAAVAIAAVNVLFAAFYWPALALVGALVRRRSRQPPLGVAIGWLLAGAPRSPPC